MRHIFLSPHMDDAVLSAGSYILRLIKKKKPVCIITVFTEFGTRPISWDAQKYLLKSGCLGISEFSKKRKREDFSAMKMNGIPFKHLDFIDGGFRKDARQNILYPTHENLFSGTIAYQDEKLIQDSKTALISVLKKSDVLYAPLGIGNHADHIIVNRIARTLPNKTYYWLDLPYAWKKKVKQQHGFRKAFRIPHQKKKEEILSCYQTQIKQLYPHGIPAIDEIFFERIPIRR